MSPNETPVIAHPFILIRQRDHRARQFIQYLFGVLTESQQVGQAGQGASMLEEVVLQQLIGGGSASNIDAIRNASGTLIRDISTTPHRDHA